MSSTRPYTTADVRAEAARQHADLADHLDRDRVGQQMCGAEIPSQTPEQDEDGDGAPQAEGWQWDEVLDDAEFDEAEHQVYDLIKGAADTSEWAIGLGADGLEPGPQYIDVAGGAGRLHIAFRPDLSADQRAQFARNVATILGEQVTEA